MSRIFLLVFGVICFVAVKAQSNFNEAITQGDDAFKNGQYCTYCITIYKDNSHSDGKDWICCDSCASWQHVSCEEKKGTYSNLHKQLSDESFQYYCPMCKNKKKKKRTTQKNDINCKIN